MSGNSFKCFKATLTFLIVTSIAYAQLPKQIIQYTKELYPNSSFPTHAQFSLYWEHFAPDSATIDPWYAIADFTGDGSTDFALMIIDSMKTKYIAIHSDGGKLEHFQIFPPNRYRDDLPLLTGIELDTRRRINETLTVDNPRIIEVENPGIHVKFFEKSSIFVYWENDRYNQLWTSD